MKKPSALLLILPVAAMLVGCTQIEETAGNIASDAASEVAGAAADEVRAQVCTLVGDGLVSPEDQRILSGLVTAAETAGVPASITEPLGEIAAAGDEVPAESVEALQEACA